MSSTALNGLFLCAYIMGGLVFMVLFSRAFFYYAWATLYRRKRLGKDGIRPGILFRVLYVFFLPVSILGSIIASAILRRNLK